MYNKASSPAISNTIIASNTANTEGGGIWCDDTSTPIIDYNDVWGNSPDDYYGCLAGPT